MNNLPVNSAAPSSPSTAQVSALSEAPARADIAPMGDDSFKAVLRKELETESEDKATSPAQTSAAQDPAIGVQFPTAAETAQAGATLEATLAMLLHAQAGTAMVQPSVPVAAAPSAGSSASSDLPATSQVVPDPLALALPLHAQAGATVTQPAVHLTAAASDSLTSSHVDPVGAAPAWMAGATRKPVTDPAAVVSPAVQPSLTGAHQTLTTHSLGLALPGDAALTARVAPRQETGLGHSASADAMQPATAGPIVAPAQESARTPGTSVVQAALPARVGDALWDQGLGERLVWMVGQRQQVAQMHLNPPELGPLTITLTLQHDQASAQFVCAQLAVREAIEAAMPRLRDMLADSGITLGNVDVGAQAFPEQAGQQERAHRGYRGAELSSPDATAPTISLLRGAMGLVDTFA